MSMHSVMHTDTDLVYLCAVYIIWILAYCNALWDFMRILNDFALHFKKMSWQNGVLFLLTCVMGSDWLHL